MNYFRFDHPELLWLLLLAAPIVWLGWRSLATLDPVRRWTAIGLRLVVLLVLVLMLAGLQGVRTHSDLTAIAVVDQSESVRRFGEPPTHAAPEERSDEGAGIAPHHVMTWVHDWLSSAVKDKRSGDQFGMVTYDGRPTVRDMPGPTVDLESGTVDHPVPGTDTAWALRTAMALFPPDSGGRLLLISDGNDTVAAGSAGQAAVAAGGAGGAAQADAQMLAAAREAAAAGIPIDVLPVPYRLNHEVMVQGVYAPTEVREGRTVALRVALRATAPARGTLQLLHDGQVVDLNGSKPGTGTPVTLDDWTAEQKGARGEGRGARCEGQS